MFVDNSRTIASVGDTAADTLQPICLWDLAVYPDGRWRFWGEWIRLRDAATGYCPPPESRVVWYSEPWFKHYTNGKRIRS
jgi:hypothetical protein